MNKWVNIKTDTSFATLHGQSPLLKCLLATDTNIELFERLITRWLPATTPSPENPKITATLNKVLEWRTLLDNKFAGRPEDREFCLLSLGHLVSAHYSGKAQSLGAIELTLIRLSNAIADKKPIAFTFCFGGYKCHTSLSHPEVDWAELFNLNYFVSYLYPIIKGYKYGVEIEYESEEVSIQFNNVPQERTDKYTASFKRLLEYYQKNALEKYGLQVKLTLIIARDFYDGGVKKLYELIEEKKPTYREHFDKKLSEAEREKWVQRAASNYMWENGIVNHGSLSETQRYDVIKEARITNEAFLEADYTLRQSWFEDKYRIPFVGTWGRMPSASPFDGWLHLKSTAASVVDCWIGTGFLEAVSKNGSTDYFETVLSKTQCERVEKGFLENSDKELKQISTNFDSVPVFTRKV